MRSKRPPRRVTAGYREGFLDSLQLTRTSEYALRDASREERCREWLRENGLEANDNVTRYLANFVWHELERNERVPEVRRKARRKVKRAR